jgi:hypothetical protein
LSGALANQNAGHQGAAWKVSSNPKLIVLEVFVADGSLVAYLQNAIKQTQFEAMRIDRQNAFAIDGKFIETEI